MILQMFKIVCFPTFQYSHKIGNTYSDICKICRILFFMMRTSLAIYMSKEDGILSTHGLS